MSRLSKAHFSILLQSKSIFAVYVRCNMSQRQKNLMAKGIPKRKKLDNVQNIIAVASGKGGVGKSTTSVNLCLALSHMDPEEQVGLLDMDVFGPSIPGMMHLDGAPEMDKDQNFIPLLNYGIKCMSMGFLLAENDPVVWRGPMVMSAIQRLLLRTTWGPLKYLVLDLPPGTGDTQLSLSQLIHVDGAVIVSTPQDVAILDARRGIEMFHQVDIPVLGLVQNMSAFECSNCGHREHIFGQDGVAKMAAKVGVDILGDIPLDPRIRVGADEGRPVTLGGVSSNPHVQAYFKIAAAVKKKLETLKSL